VIGEGHPQDRARALKVNFNPRWLWAALVVLLSCWILRSFFEPLAWASIIAIATWPVYRRFAQRLPGRVASNVTPLLFTVLVSLFVLGPIVFAFGALVSEAHRWIDQIAVADKTGLASPAWLQTLPIVGAKLAERWQEQLGTPGAMSVWLQRADASAALGWAQTLGEFMAHHLFIVIFTILVLFFLYRGGDALALRVDNLLHDTLGDHGESYVALAIRAVRATVSGMVVVAFFDGVLTGITYALAGVQRPEVWGAVTGLFATIPFLGYAAVAGVALVLAVKSAAMAALVVCALGFLVVFAGDKIVRPMLVGGAVQLGFVWVLMGSLGGLELLGLLGLFVGPVVLALGGALWRDWTTSRSPSRVPPVSAAATASA
jgi:predicted PurR-regulated permease PerM